MYWIVYKKPYLSPNTGKQWQIGDIRQMADEQRSPAFDDVVVRFDRFDEIKFEDKQENVKVFAIGEEIAVKVSKIGADFYNNDGQQIMWLNKKGVDAFCDACSQK